MLSPWKMRFIFRPMVLPGVLAIAAQVALPAASAEALPVAPVRDVVEHLHGVTVHDPYRYMENVKDPEVQSWLKAQGEEARRTLDRIAVRDDLQKRIQALDRAQGDVIQKVTRLSNGAVFYLKRVQGERQFKLMTRATLTSAERLVVDPELESQRTGVPHAINYFVPSWDGKHVAYGMSAGGSELAYLYVMNLSTGRNIGQPIARVQESNVSWLPDSQSLTYNQLKQPRPGDAETEFFMDSQVMWLRLGQAQARAVFGPTVTRQLGLGRLDVGGLQFRPGSKWMLARTTDTTVPEGFLFVAQLKELSKRVVPWRKISQFDDKIIDVALKGDDVYLLAYANAPRNRVLKLNLKQPDLALAQEVATAPANAVLESFTLSRDAVLGAVREGTSIGLRRYSPGDPSGAPVPMPYPGAVEVHADLAAAFNDTLYSMRGWDTPARLWMTDGTSNTEVAWLPTRAKTGAFDLEVTNLGCKSHDGVMVPMTVLHQKGLPLNGKNPTLLNGYGAYGHSQTAFYRPSGRAWMERGGVLAYVNVRGSGVYGQDWYRAGQKATKANTWKDGIACARTLIERGYASPATLAVIGGSAGGIFAGRSATEAPELFAAAVIQVGVTDTVRAEESANGVTNISEFGSYKNPQEFPALLEMSTYHQIHDGTSYPAVLLMHGMNDPRVDVWQSAKAGARFKAASGSGKPVLLRLDAQAGHGVGSTATQRQAEAADIYSFLLWQMGLATLRP